MRTPSSSARASGLIAHQSAGVSFAEAAAVFYRGSAPYTTQVAAPWTLSDAAIERIEKIRSGGNLTIYPDFR